MSDHPLSPYPKISIVTPSLNQGEFLEETIRSVLSQEYPSLEYIVMDGCSTDNSLDILRTFEMMISDGRYRPRCKAVSYRWFLEKKKGQADAIKKGLVWYSGEAAAAGGASGHPKTENVRQAGRQGGQGGCGACMLKLAT